MDEVALTDAIVLTEAHVDLTVLVSLQCTSTVYQDGKVLHAILEVFLLECRSFFS